MSGIIIAGTHSGCGKTTITLGLMAALKKKGFTIQPFKVGPDFIDTGLHRIITGRPSRNLDLWMCGEEYVKKCFYRHSLDADISIVEGVMGLYDGELSTARLAEILDLPIVLVVNAFGMAESAGAVVKGFIEYKNKDLIKGIIFNQVASERHFKRLKNSVRDVEVFGYLPRDLRFEISHRHLGLVVAEENPITSEAIESLADAFLEHVDIKKIVKSGAQKSRRFFGANQSRNKAIDNPSYIKKGMVADRQIVIAIAYDKAFCFYYEDNLDLLKQMGAEIMRFSPLNDQSLPKADALYIGGGYPELYAEKLSKNRSMLDAIYDWAISGKPLYAECGGLMYLSRGIHDLKGNFFKMVGVFPFETKMRNGRSHLGYRNIQLKEDCILGKKGDWLRGHEFHYSEIKPSAFSLQPSALTTCYSLFDNTGQDLQNEGYRFKNTLASYVHIHLGSNYAIAKNFINFVKEC